nr:Chain B, Afimbrial adhesin AFA-III [Escherichia coli]2VER_A Chain A, AFIMBRIAL ADHESIN AFA-III [Escherichia coli]
EECQVRVGDLTVAKTRGQLTDAAPIGPVTVQALGCNARQVALKADTDNFEQGKFFLISDNNRDKLYVNIRPMDNSAWTTDNGVFYKNDVGSWGGTIGIYVDGQQTNTPPGNYTLTLTGGYWAKDNKQGFTPSGTTGTTKLTVT